MEKDNKVDYEYLEQMLSICEYKKKKFKKMFTILLDADLYSDGIERIREGILMGNVFYIAIHFKRLTEEGLLNFAGFEAEALIGSYLIIKLIERFLEKFVLEKIDLDQLSIDNYNNLEKEKGLNAQMTMIKESKSYVKKRSNESIFDD